MTNSTRRRALFRADQVRELDSIAINVGAIAGIQLMKRAGRVIFQQLRSRWPLAQKVFVCCGGGNNAGDGYIVAALAAQKCMQVQVLSAVPTARLNGDAAAAMQFALAEGVQVTEVDDWASCLTLFDEQSVVVDALLGTGMKGEVRVEYERAINAINAGKARVIAADVPSGICSDTGVVLGAAVKADVTVTFVGLKQGLLTASAPEYAGEMCFDELGVPFREAPSPLASAYAEVQPSAEQITRKSYRLKARPADAHKGLYGHVLIVGGDAGFGGAVAMAAEACARVGAGLVSVATQAVHVAPVLARLPEVMVNAVASGQELEPHLVKPSVIVVGPGLGRSPWSEQMLQQVMKTGLPLVVDADALNILAAKPACSEVKRQNWVFTPHPGEAARLLGCTIDDIQADRFSAARAIQAKFGGVVVLKGAGTIIASATETLVAKVGNPGMATGGMGDILAGIIGALLAQGLGPAEAAGLGVCVHGDAADLAAFDGGQRGMLATDLISHIRKLVNPGVPSGG